MNEIGIYIKTEIFYVILEIKFKKNINELINKIKSTLNFKVYSLNQMNNNFTDFRTYTTAVACCPTTPPPTATTARCSPQPPTTQSRL